MRRLLIPLCVLVALIAGVSAAVAATSSVSLGAGDAATVTCPTSLWKQATTAQNWTVHCKKASVSPSPTTTSAGPSTSSSPAPTPTTTAPAPGACTADLGQTCGGYKYAGIPNSNGYNTYVSNQDVGSQTGTTQTATVVDPGNWSLTANDVPYGYGGVQSFPDVQQLMNNWCGTGWGGCANESDTPLDSLSALTVNYSETSPRDGNSLYEFAPDVWTDGYPSDVMFWVDTHGRCNNGAFGDTILGHATFDGQSWTVHRYGGAGAEIIFTLDDGAGGCAQQTSGTVDIKAGYAWLSANVPGFPAQPVISQLNTGWEITSADNATFQVSSYSITETVG